MSKIKTNRDTMLLTVRDAAERLGIGRNKMYDMIHAGHIQTLKISGMKIPVYELERFAQESLGMNYDDVNHPVALD